MPRMDAFEQALRDLDAGGVMAAPVAALAIGLVYCFLGYPLFRFMLALTGFLLAGAMAGALGGFLTEGNPWWVLGLGAVGGICGAFAMYWLYRTGVFLIAALGGGAAGYTVLSVEPQPWLPLAVLGIGLVAGLIGLFLEKPLMRLATAALGSAIAVQAGFALLPDAMVDEWRATPGAERYVFGGVVVVWVLLLLMGFSTQWSIGRRGKRVEVVRR